MPLRFEHLDFAYRPGRPVLRAVTASLPPGQLTVILGPNGSGKSTLLRLALGLLRPARGAATLDGTPTWRLAEPARAARIAYCPQRTSLAAPFTVAQFVRLGRFALPPDEHAVAAALERMELAERAADRFDTLSAGQQQRAAIARVLAQVAGDGPPRFILADEPCAAMDPRHALAAMSVLREQASARGLGVAVVLHDFAIARRFADAALLLDAEGSVAAQGNPEHVLAPGPLERVFGVPFEVHGQGPRAALLPAVPPASEPPPQTRSPGK
ncbi:MAG: ABC transporter ATP-binding protein [Phycisphaerae bacterium]|nr:ABC transporter ATP-binding protein [Phycisphaerae bacterium]